MSDLERRLQQELGRAGADEAIDPSVRERVIARIVRRRRIKAGGAGLLAVTILTALLFLPRSEELAEPPTPPANGTEEVEEDEREATPEVEEPEPDEGEPEATPEGGRVEPVGPGGLEEVLSDGFPRGGGEMALLGDVRVAGHDGFDRIVLEFESGDEPTYRVAYIDPPVVEDGSGWEIDVEGEAFLELRLSPASGFIDSGDGLVETYEGPRRVGSGDTGMVTEVVRTGDYEATLAWVVGMRSETPFAVRVFEEPLRLVVDIVYR